MATASVRRPGPSMPSSSTYPNTPLLRADQVPALDPWDEEWTAPYPPGERAFLQTACDMLGPKGRR